VKLCKASFFGAVISSDEWRLQMKMTRNIGMLLLALWLILTGLIPLLNLNFSGLGTVMAILAIAAGILIAIGR
jgi:hypothetical protein